MWWEPLSELGRIAPVARKPAGVYMYCEQEQPWSSETINGYRSRKLIRASSLALAEEYRQHFGEQQALDRLGEELLAAMDRIRRRLGGLRHQQLRQQLSEALAVQAISGDTRLHEDWIRTLLGDYYDPMYDYMLSHREGEIIFEGSRDEVMAFLGERQMSDV